MAESSVVAGVLFSTNLSSVERLRFLSGSWRIWDFGPVAALRVLGQGVSDLGLSVSVAGYEACAPFLRQVSLRLSIVIAQTAVVGAVTLFTHGACTHTNPRQTHAPS